MNKKIISVLLLFAVFFIGAVSIAKADDNDYGERLMKALGVSKKNGMEGLQQDKEIGQLRMTISTIMNISTALEMFATDHAGKYPATLDELSPDYIRNVPKGLSKAGYFPFVYNQKNGGKDYIFYCKGSNYSQFGIPADYPRCISDSKKKFNNSLIMLKPGVLNPPYRKPTETSKARDLFKEAVTQLPDLIQKKDPKQAKDVRLKLTKAIQSGKLDPKEVDMAKRIIEDCKKIEQGRMK